MIELKMYFSFAVDTKLLDSIFDTKGYVLAYVEPVKEIFTFCMSNHDITEQNGFMIFVHVVCTINFICFFARDKAVNITP